MIHRPAGVGAFQFAVVASLRANQLSRGCPPRVDLGHCVAVTAQMEVAEGAVAALSRTAIEDAAAEESSLLVASEA